MKITLKLFAMLERFLPPGSMGNQTSLEISEGESLEGVLAMLSLPRELTHLVLINGTYVAPNDRKKAVFKDGDVLAIWPPIAGG